MYRGAAWPDNRRKKSPSSTRGFTSTQTSLNTGSELWVRVFVISAEPGSKPVASSSLFLFVHIIYVSPCKVVRVNARFMWSARGCEADLTRQNTGCRRTFHPWGKSEVQPYFSTINMCWSIFACCSNWSCNRSDLRSCSYERLPTVISIRNYLSWSPFYPWCETLLVIGKIKTISPSWLMMNPMHSMRLRKKQRSMTR